MRITVPLIYASIFFLLSMSFFSPSPAVQKNAPTFHSFKIDVPSNASAELNKIASIFERQIFQRCGIQKRSRKNSQLNIELLIDQNIGSESFSIEDGKKNVIRIIGGDEKGVLFGVGKFLRSSSFYQNTFVAGSWRGISSPECPVRTIYLATHFKNYYEAAPIEDVMHYIEDLGLWGYNTIIIHYPTWQYVDLEDPEAQRWLERFKTILAGAKNCGLDVGLIQCPNQGYKSAPDDLRGPRVPGHRRGNHGVNLCASKPEAQSLLVDLYSDLFDQFKEIELDFFISWPYDEGGCACDECWPWGARGFLDMSKEMEKLFTVRFPKSKFVLSTWCFENEDDSNPDGEWVGLEESMRQDKSWVDYVMADGHDDYFPQYLLEQGVPGKLPLLNFPEISMFGMSPWGGYGTNPAPEHFQLLWDRIKEKDSGGAPYSEGIYEDINKAIIAGFYWNRERKAKDTVKEYLSFEFSPDVADDMLEVVRIFEQNHNRKNIQHSAVRAFELVEKANDLLAKKVQDSWRWRIFYLRALIDKELYQRNGKLEGEILKAAFVELTRLYHAENAHSMPIKPPEVK
jgi:hypothetical protein